MDSKGFTAINMSYFEVGYYKLISMNLYFLH
jgi:hypothetical protein